MRILYLTYGQSPHDLRFTRALTQTQHEIYVLCMDGILSGWPAKVILVPWKPGDKRRRGLLRQVLKLKRVIREFKPDLIHAGPIQGPAFRVVLTGFHPLVTMSWGFDLLRKSDYNWLWHQVTGYVLERSDVLVGDCEAIFNKAAEFGFPAERFKKFPWGVDLNHFVPSKTPNLRRDLGWLENPVLLCNRSMEPQYGVDIAVRGFISAHKENHDLRLLLFGRGSQEKNIRHLVDSAGLNNAVHFGGFVDQEGMPDIYNSADLYLTASHTDGSSVSLLEALACGLPVIVSDIPSNQEWICHGREGWIFPDNDVDDLAHKITQAVSARNYWSMIGAHNREVAEDGADWTKNFPVLLQAYEQALSIHRQSTT